MAAILHFLSKPCPPLMISILYREPSIIISTLDQSLCLPSAPSTLIYAQSSKDPSGSARVGLSLCLSQRPYALRYVRTIRLGNLAQRGREHPPGLRVREISCPNQNLQKRL